MSEITTANAYYVNTLHVQLQIPQQSISAVETESHAEESCRPPSSIIGVRNEQANLRSRIQSGDQYIRKVKVQISSQSSSKCMILEPHTGTPATKKWTIIPTGVF